jgi:hypothetical protein
MLSAAYIGSVVVQFVLFVEPTDTVPAAPAVQPSLGAAVWSGFMQLVRPHSAALAGVATIVAAPVARFAESVAVTSAVRHLVRSV